jgi:polyhydroxyalkanoate synthase
MNQMIPDISNMNKLFQNAIKINQKCQTVIQKFMENQKESDEVVQKELEVIGKSFQELSYDLMSNPGRLFEFHMVLWQEYWALFQKSAAQFFGQPHEPEVAGTSPDKRFRDDAWNTNPFFNFIKQNYLLTAKLIRKIVKESQGLDTKTRQKVTFYTNQYIDAISPTNFVATNPEVLRLTIETNGQNLLDGLDNLLADLDRGPCQLQIKMSDMDSMEVGRDFATTPGKVVFQNEMMQLIQYAPTTDKVFETPLLFIPPWINKYYILDLNEKKSMVKWMVDKGYTVFIMSWANPDEVLRDKDFENYMLEGPVTALRQIERLTGQKQVNTIGYCMGGTLLACTTAYLTAIGEAKRIASATYMTTLLDFSKPGDVGIYIDEEQIAAFEKKMHRQGYLDGCAMSNSFSMLRANDLVWSYVINNYLKGTSPVPFDVLFWNSDSTNMPAKMHSFYLRNMYLHNRLAQPNGITLDNVPIDLSAIQNPVYFFSAKEDHIALWKSTYDGIKLHSGADSGQVRFVLGGSGHIAGVINPPGRIKYGHWTNERLTDSPDTWLEGTEYHEHSWWPDWLEWNSAYTGKLIPARRIEQKDGRLEDAPGCYVTKRLDIPESGVCYMPGFFPEEENAESH